MGNREREGGRKGTRRREAVEEPEQRLQQHADGAKVRKGSKLVTPRGKNVYASTDDTLSAKRSRDGQLPPGDESLQHKRTRVDDEEVCTGSKNSSSNNTTAVTSLEAECYSEASDCGQKENAAAGEVVVASGEGRRVRRRSSVSSGAALAAADELKSPMTMAKYVAEHVGSDSQLNGDEPARDAKLVGTPFTKTQAMARWPHRYQSRKKVLKDASNRLNTDSGYEENWDCVAHYSKAEVDGVAFELDDHVEVNNEAGKNFVGKIIEMFENRDGSPYITTQWFFFPEETKLQEDGKDTKLHNPRRLFFSDVRDVNPLDCLVKKVSIHRVHPTVQLNKDILLPHTDYVYDMGYAAEYSAFYTLPADEVSSTGSQEATGGLRSESSRSSPDEKQSETSELSLLDLYAGCGAMSTGLCSGARLAGHNLVSRWAVDVNEEACESYKYNHPETEVRNEEAGDFFALIQAWQQLCAKYPVGSSVQAKAQQHPADDQPDDVDDPELSEEVFEVEKLLAVKHEGSKGLLFKVRWKGYEEDEDTWEPLGNLENCPERLEQFVLEGRRNKILPLPGEVDVICGGPPCQGASGFNRFRNSDNPLADEKNHQMVVYMNIVEYLKPRYLLMENVVDILKFCKGVLGRYALSRLVSMHYQAKIGLMAAGSYGLPQYRMRVFLWGAATTEKLPAFPLPTHHVAKNRGNAPVEWERNLVGDYDDETHCLEQALVLKDAISDLPPITNSETREERPYEKLPESSFQRLVRMPKPGEKQPVLYNHKPLTMNKDDYDRACQIPKKKGANFRHLDGVIELPDHTATLDPKNRKMLASGKPLVPDYAISFVKGKSRKPFGRLWWDETVSTVVTRAEPHNQAVLHPEQDRVLSIRENARLQGFPDHYRLFGDTKEKYKQVGNAVAVPVARALGYALGKALSDDVSGANLVLPRGFPLSLIDESGPTRYALDLPQNLRGSDLRAS